MATAAKATTLITPQQAAKLDKARSARGFYIPRPTVDQIRYRHLQKKGWYAMRDTLIQEFQAMTELRSPFKYDRKGEADSGYRLPSGDLQFSVATFPFDITTLAQSMMANKHPYIDATPANSGQSETQVKDLQKFMQGFLDMRMQQSNFLARGIMYLMTTGWLVALHPYDKSLDQQGRFPYDLQLVSPIGVYPELNSRYEPIWVTRETRVTGAALLQDYAMYPGIAEIIESMPDIPKVSENYNTFWDAFNTTEFTVTRYYDDTYTALLVDGSDVSDTLIQYNPALRKLKTSGKVGQSILWGSSHSSDPYHGVIEHHQGCIPMSFAWCWPEIRDVTSFDQSGIAGRFIGLPFLYSQHTNWKDISRFLGMMHTKILRNTKPKVITNADSVKSMNSEIIHLGEGENLSYLQEPPMSPEVPKLFEMMQEETQKGSFTDAAFGASSGTSGIQQQSTQVQGSLRADFIAAEVERGIAGACTGITYTMIERKDGDEYFVWGNGKRYGGKPYTMKYKIGSTIEQPPGLVVKLKAFNGLKNERQIATFKSLEGKYPFRRLAEEILDEPDGEIIEQEMRQEAASREASAMKLETEMYILKRKLELAEKKAKLEFELETAEDEAQEWQEKKRIEREMSQIPQDVQTKMMENLYQQIMTSLMGQMGLQQPSPTPFGMQPPTTTTPPAMTPPPSMNGLGQPPMPPPTGLGAASPLSNPMTASSPGLTTPPGSMNTYPPMGTAPGQAAQPIQPPSRMSGISQTGIDSIAVGSNNPLAQIPPEIAAANAAVAAPPEPQLIGAGANYRNKRRRRR